MSACIVLELVLQPGPDPALHAAAEGPDNGPSSRSQVFWLTTAGRLIAVFRTVAEVAARD